VRILVTWTHPELHPSLWTTALGTPMPSPDNFPMFGVAEATLTASPATAELRLEPDDAARAGRLGLSAIITVIKGSGTPAETIAKKEVTFGSVAAPVSRLIVTFDGALRIEPAARAKDEGGGR
jgi:Ca-activated chloride channel family protein